MDRKRRHRISHLIFRITGILFLALVLGLSLVNYLLPDREFSEQENRMLAQKPQLRLDSLADGSYMEKYESYQADQFAGRDTWMEISSGMELLLGQRESNGVFKGKDHCLLEDLESDSGENVQENVNAINAFAERNQDRKLYAMFVPDAAEIWKDKLPAFAVTEDQSAQLDRLRAELPDTMQWIDAGAALEEHKDEAIYYNTDHHWTTLGAYYAFQNAKEVLGLDEAYAETYTPYAVTNPFNGTLAARSGYERGQQETIYIYFPDGENPVEAVVHDVENGQKTASLYAPEKLEEKDKYAVFLGGNSPLLDIRTTSDSTETLLIFKDSYANCFIPFLIPYYRQILVVDPRYYYGNVQELIEENQIANILFLYNANTFFTDNSLSGVLDV